MLEHDQYDGDRDDDDHAQETLIGRLTVLLKQMVVAEHEVHLAEEELKKRNKTFNHFKFKAIPELLEEMGCKPGSEVTVAVGDQLVPLKLEEKMHAKLSDAKRDIVLALMKKNGQEHLINSNVTVAFTRGQQDEMKRFMARLEVINQEELMNGGINYGVKEEIHPSTYSSWCDKNLRDDPSVSLSDFGAYLQKQVSVGKPKKQKSKR